MGIIKEFREVLIIGIFISFFFTVPASAATILIGNFNVVPDSTATGSLKANEVINLASVTVNLTYDPLVVSVTEVSRGSGNSLDTPTFNINTAKGLVTIIADNALGKSGEVVIANITFKAVGSAGSSSALNIGINELIDTNYQSIPATPANGSFIIAGGKTATPTPITTSTSSSSANPNRPVSSGNNNDIPINAEEETFLLTTPPPAAESTPMLPVSTLSVPTTPIHATSSITFAVTGLLAWFALVLIKKKRS